MPEPWLSTVEKLTEFFSTDQSEASARRTKFAPGENDPPEGGTPVTTQVFLSETWS